MSECSASALINPDNVSRVRAWPVHGYILTCMMQSKDGETKTMKEQFHGAWSHSYFTMANFKANQHGMTHSVTMRTCDDALQGGPPAARARIIARTVNVGKRPTSRAAQDRSPQCWYPAARRLANVCLTRSVHHHHGIHRLRPAAASCCRRLNPRPVTPMMISLEVPLAMSDHTTRVGPSYADVTIGAPSISEAWLSQGG